MREIINLNHEPDKSVMGDWFSVAYSAYWKSPFLKLCLVLVIVSLFSCKKKEEEGKPNILLIVADDLGYADMSFLPNASNDVSTPNIDRLAEDGSYFSNAYSTSPICSPSRAGLITGRYQQRWGNYWYGEGGLPASEYTIPQMLESENYQSYKIGKTHLNGGPVEHPLDHGFGEFLGFIDHTWDYLRLSENDVEAYGEENARKAHIGPLTHNREKVSYEDDYTTDIFSEKVVDIIKSESDNPFYVQLSYNAVHHPTYVCHPDYLDDFGIEQFPFWDPEEESYRQWHKKWGHLWEVDPNGRKRYLLQLKVMDDGIGRIIDALKSTGQYENTLIAFVSDNGGTINTYSNNQPLNGYKYMFGEGGIRVPMMISWPQYLPENNREDALVSVIDIFPTLANATGQSFPDNLDGKSLIPLLEGKTDQVHDALFFSDGRDSWVVRHGRWKLAHNLEWKHRSFRIENGRAVRDSPYVYPGGLRLYDLKQDIAEQNDLSGLHPEIVDSLQQMYKRWRDKMEDPTAPSWSDEPVIPEDEEFPPANKEYEVDVWSDGSHQNHYPRLAVDENPDTWWQTQSGNIAMPFPHRLVVDNKKPSLIKGISYLSAPGQGRIKDFEVYVSNSRDDWGNPVHKDQLKNNDKEQKIQFARHEKGRYLKFKVLSSYNNDMIARVSELKIITD